MGRCSISRYGAEKAIALLEDFSAAVSAFDGNAAGKAETVMMQVELNKLGERLFQAEALVGRASSDVEEMQQAYHRYLYAARALKQETEEIKDGRRRRELEISLVRLIDELERSTPALCRAREDNSEAELWTSRLRTSFEILSKKLARAHEASDSRHRPAASKDRGQRPNASRRLTSALAAISVSLDSMNRKVAAARLEPDFFGLKGSLFDDDRLCGDPHIAAALDPRSEKTVVDRHALYDRLARLDGLQPLPSASAA